MRFRFHINQDFAAGVMFAAWGVLGLWIARNYPMGTSLRMGPGYMPALLCWGLILLGAIIAGKGALIPGAPLTRWYFRPLILVLAGLLAFALLIERAGLPIAILVAASLGAAGGQDFRSREAALLAVGLALGSVAIFVYALRVPMAVWPS